MIQVGAINDPMAAQFEAAGMPSRGFAAAFRVSGGAWKVCTVDHGAGGRHPIRCATAEAAKSAAKEWLKKRGRK